VESLRGRRRSATYMSWEELYLRSLACLGFIFIIAVVFLISWCYFREKT